MKWLPGSKWSVDHRRRKNNNNKKKNIKIDKQTLLCFFFFFPPSSDHHQQTASPLPNLLTVEIVFCLVFLVGKASLWAVFLGMFLFHFNHYILFPSFSTLFIQVAKKTSVGVSWYFLNLLFFSSVLCFKHWQAVTWFHFAVVMSHLDIQKKIKMSEKHNSAAGFHWKVMWGDPKFIAYEIRESLWIYTIFEKLPITFLSRSFATIELE